MKVIYTQGKYFVQDSYKVEGKVELPDLPENYRWTIRKNYGYSLYLQRRKSTLGVSHWSDVSEYSLFVLGHEGPERAISRAVREIQNKIRSNKILSQITF